MDYSKKRSILILLKDPFPLMGACSNIVCQIVDELSLNYNTQVEYEILCTRETVFGKRAESVKSILNVSQVSKKECMQLLHSKHFMLGLSCLIVKVVSKLINGFLHLDCSFLLIWSFYRYVKKYHSRYDFFFAVGGGFEPLIALLKLAKQKEIKYVFYQVDPFVDNKVYSRLWQKRRERILKNLYRKAYFICIPSFISFELQDTQSKVVKMELPLVRIHDNREYNRELKSAASKELVNCYFVGQIYGGIRNPDYSIKLFSELTNVVLHFVGVEKGEIMSHNTECHGKVSLEEAKMYMMQADFLVNIGNNTINQIPSKLFDYISCQKPIINIIKFKDCPTIEILKHYPLALTVIEDENSFSDNKRKLVSFIKKNKGKEVSAENIIKEFKQYTAHFFVNRLLFLLINFEKGTRDNDFGEI